MEHTKVNGAFSIASQYLLGHALVRTNIQFVVLFPNERVPIDVYRVYSPLGIGSLTLIFAGVRLLRPNYAGAFPADTTVPNATLDVDTSVRTYLITEEKALSVQRSEQEARASSCWSRKLNHRDIRVTMFHATMVSVPT